MHVAQLGLLGFARAGPPPVSCLGNPAWTGCVQTGLCCSASGASRLVERAVRPPSHLRNPRRLHRQHTVSDLAWEYVKDIGRLGRDLANVVIVDDNAAMFMYQPRNALHVQAYEVARRSAASACRAAGLYREAEEQHEGSESEDGDDVLARVEGILLQQVRAGERFGRVRTCAKA